MINNNNVTPSTGMCNPAKIAPAGKTALNYTLFLNWKTKEFVILV